MARAGDIIEPKQMASAMAFLIPVYYYLCIDEKVIRLPCTVSNWQAEKLLY